MAQAYSDAALLWSTIFFAIFGAIRLAATSGYAWLRDAAAAWVPLEYLFVAIAVFLGIYGWTGRTRLALIIAGLTTVAYYFVNTGAML